jgi:hypothetical protein
MEALAALPADPSERQQPVSVSSIQTVVKSYHQLRRPYRQGTAAHDCLPRSLALAAVLRRRHIRADVCIGITDLPFTSHAWVEAAEVILNDTLSYCRRFTIIGRF